MKKKRIYKKNGDVTKDWTQIAGLGVRHFTRMFSEIVWGCNWMLFMHGWFCPIRLIGDSKSYLSGLPQLRINVWAYFGGFFLALSWIKCRKVTMHKCPCMNVLNIETKPRMGDRENWTNRKFLKLNQWKICISHYVLLSAERSSCVNVHA